MVNIKGSYISGKPKTTLLLNMEKNLRKDILIDGMASLVGLVIALYSLVTLKEPTLLKLVTTMLAVGVFLFCGIRYGRRFRQLQKKEKG